MGILKRVGGSLLGIFEFPRGLKGILFIDDNGAFLKQPIYDLKSAHFSDHQALFEKRVIEASQVVLGPLTW
jgi:hypothetical protein